MRRREFISLLGSAASIWPIVARAQQAERIHRVGVLANYTENDDEETKRISALRQRLQELGWIEGKNLKTDIRFSGSDAVRLRSDANQLIALSYEVIVSTTSRTTRTLLDATNDIPIVAATSGDPIGLGFTKSLSRPTGNVTGFTTFNDTLAAKRFEMLREILPATRKTALIWNPTNPQQELLEKQTEKAAETFGIELLSLPLQTANDIPAALTKAQSEGVEALIVAADPLTTSNHRAIIQECLARKIPAMHTYAFEAENGALISYGIDLLENYRRTAEYVDHIFRGTKIADLPFQEPTRLYLAINLRTARALGVDAPAALLAAADKVIE
jgi:putative ABC transport system substrate-binding protein